jgi:hypothetical protein
MNKNVPGNPAPEEVDRLLKGGNMNALSRNACLAACMILTVCLLSTCSGETIRIPGRYYHDELKFSIEMPDDWEIREGDGVESSLVEAVSPWEDDEDAFSEYIGVDVEELPGKIELDELFDSMREEQAREFSYFKELDRGDITIDRQDAKYLFFEFEIPEGRNRAISYTLVKGGKGFLISCVAEASKYDRYADAFETAAVSFRFE